MAHRAVLPSRNNSVAFGAKRTSSRSYEYAPEALAAIARQRPDLILMDIQLPTMDGYTATSRIKADPALRSIPIIAVTSYALSGEERKARGIHKVIFPGDMEKPGWKSLLNNAAFRAELSGVNIFFASHHGRENGYCEEVLQLCPNLRIVVISDKKMGFQSQETVDKYRAYARGFYYYGQERRVLTTRRDGKIRFDVPISGNANVVLGLAA